MKTNNHFLNTVENTVKKNNLIGKNESVLIAVSGGADSISLLTVILELSQKLKLKIGIAHLDHDLRGEESRRDSDFVENLAQKKRIPLHLETADVIRFKEKNRLSLEDAARKLRYAFLQRTAQKNGYDKIATGHTANDNAELILMNLLRGAGPSGLSGIPVKRDNIIRPIIELTRKDVTDYLSLKNASYITDSSNSNKAFLRNKIRLELLPHLEEEYNSNIIEGLNRTGRIIKDEENWVEEMADRLFNDVLEKSTDNSVTLTLSLLKTFHPAAKRRVVRKALGVLSGGLKKFTSQHIESVLDLVDRSESSVSVDLPEQIRVQKKKSSLVLMRHETGLRYLKKENIRYTYIINQPDAMEAAVRIPEISKTIRFSILDNNDNINFNLVNQQAAYIDFNKLDFPLFIREPRPKDSFVPFGMTGSQTLKKFFSGRGIISEDKKNYPLLLNNDDIVWIGGQRLHNSYKIHENTKKILKVELFLD